MSKRLYPSVFKEFRFIGSYILLLVFLFSYNTGHAQAIVEAFEDASAWPANTTFSGSLSVQSSATSASQAISTWNGATTVTTSTAAASLASQWIWGASGVSTYSTNYSTCESVVHSLNHSLHMIQNQAYVVSPIMSGGISTVTFWMGGYYNGGPDV